MYPKFANLQLRLQLNGSALKKMILRAPSILSCSVENSIAPTLDWLEERLGLNENELRRLAHNRPQLLVLKLENLRSKLEFLQFRLHVDDLSLKRIVLRSPTILICSTDKNIAPTLDWLKKTLDLDDVPRVLLK